MSSTAKQSTKKSIVIDEVVMDPEQRDYDLIAHEKLLKYLKGEKKIGPDECVVIHLNNVNRTNANRAQHLCGALQNLGGKLVPEADPGDISEQINVARAIETKIALLVTVYNDADKTETIAFERGFKITVGDLAKFPNWNDDLGGLVRIADRDGKALQVFDTATGRLIWCGSFVAVNYTAPWKSYIRTCHLSHIDDLDID